MPQAQVVGYDRLYREFRWLVPAHFNISTVCSTRWARDPRRIAIQVDHGDGRVDTLSYTRLEADANRLANALAADGVRRGERVALLLPQCPETAIAQMGILRMGAVAMPLSVLFGADAIAWRLQDSEARTVIVDAGALDTLRKARLEAGTATRIIVVGDDATPLEGRGETHWNTLLAGGSERYRTVDTRADDPALLIYTSGTTGPPKGALIPHRTLIGHLPGFVASQDWFPQPGDVFWSPADWAWAGGLMDALLPTLYFGHPIVASRSRFSAEGAFELMQRHGVTNTFLFPTALKMMMKAVPAPRERYRLRLRAIMSGGESVGDAVFDWSGDALGITINEIFGQTEANYLMGGSSRLWPARSGAIGRPYPGHRIALLDDQGDPVAPGETGEIAVNRYDIHGDPDPVLFLGYWNRPEATEAKYTGDWCRTGDLASVDPEGYYWYRGRADDMFKAAGYRIGPSEVENCLIGHPAVVNAAVVPKPDAERGNLVKAYVVLAPGHEPGPALVEELQQHVRGRLAPYEYPKEISFIDELPMTTTGKIQRRVLRLREQEAAAAPPAPPR